MQHKRYYPLLSILAVLIMFFGMVGPVSARLEAGTAIRVSTVEDEVNADGDCSLREAIQAANTGLPVDACPAGSGDDRILLPAGVYQLSIPGKSEDSGLTGDLDISRSLTIRGEGADRTLIDGGGLDRVLHIVGSAAVRIENVAIQNGYAQDTGQSILYGGGGILNEKGELTLDHSLVQNNTSTLSGGGLENTGSTTVIDSTFQGNQASAGGGIFNSGTIFLENTTLTGNSASVTGGGLDNKDSGELTNVTLSGNAAPEGEQLFTDGSLALVNSTVVSSLTGIANKGDEIRFKNTIVANTSEDADNCSGHGTFISEGQNLENKNTCNFDAAGDLVDTEPLLGPLADNQGPTLTHALQPGSPAIDRGDDAVCPASDQRRAYRPADGDADGSASCDIGSYEYLASFPQPYSPFVYLPLISRH